MARIELSFYDNKYTIEYNRASIREFLSLKNVDNEIDQVVALIKCGLQMHHEDDMPSDEMIVSWVLALGDDVKPFAEALTSLVQDVLEALKADRKNLKWGKVEA